MSVEEVPLPGSSRRYIFTVDSYKNSIPCCHRCSERITEDTDRPNVKKIVGCKLMDAGTPFNNGADCPLLKTGASS